MDPFGDWDDGDAGLDGDHTADAHSLMQPRHVFNASAGAEEYGEEWMEHLGGGEGERLAKDESFDASTLNISDIVRKTDMARRRGPAQPESLWDQHNLEAAPGADDASLSLGEKRKAGAAARSAKRAKRSTSSDESDDGVSLGESEEATEAVRLYGSVGDTLPGARAPLSYSRAERKRPKPWSQREVARLFNALSMFGSNFNTIVHMFPGRTVKDVRRRYKQEYDRNPKRVMRALTERKPVNQEKFNRYKELSTTVKKIRNEMENGDTTENPLQEFDQNGVFDCVIKLDGSSIPGLTDNAPVHLPPPKASSAIYNLLETGPDLEQLCEATATEGFNEPPSADLRGDLSSLLNDDADYGDGGLPAF